MASTARDTSHDREIWNPWAAIWLSLIFTPVFGAMLHGTDLRHIGDKDGALAAFLWERVSMILLALAAVFQPVAALRPGWQFLLLTVDLGLWVLWVATCGIRHAREIGEALRLSKNLEPVSTSKAITLGLLGMLSWTALFYIAKIVWQLTGVIPE